MHTYMCSARAGLAGLEVELAALGFVRAASEHAPPSYTHRDASNKSTAAQQPGMVPHEQQVTGWVLEYTSRRRESRSNSSLLTIPIRAGNILTMGMVATGSCIEGAACGRCPQKPPAPAVCAPPSTTPSTAPNATRVDSWRDLVTDLATHGLPLSEGLGEPLATTSDASYDTSVEVAARAALSSSRARAHVNNLRRLSDRLANDVAIQMRAHPTRSPLLPPTNESASSLEAARRLAHTAYAAASRGALVHSHPVQLPVCGLRMELPFGGKVLAEFDMHLRTYGSIGDGPGGRHVGGGYSHELSSPGVQQARAFNASGLPANVLVRRSSMWTVTHAHAKPVCERYRFWLRSAYMQWLFGEFGLLPKLHAAWIQFTPMPQRVHERFSLVTVVDRYQPLWSVVHSKNGSQSLAESVAPDQSPQLLQSEYEHAEMATQALRRFELLARLRVAGLDMKEKDMVIRHHPPGLEHQSGGEQPQQPQPQAQWEVRLVDLDEERWTFFAPAARVPCLHLMSLQLPTVTLVCGPMRHTPFAKHFATGALRSTSDLPRLDTSCLPHEGHFSHWRDPCPVALAVWPLAPGAENSTLGCHMEHPRSKLHMNALYTGPHTDHNLAVLQYFAKSIHEIRALRGKNVENKSGISGEAFRIHQMIYDNWRTKGTAECPVGWSWD